MVEEKQEGAYSPPGMIGLKQIYYFVRFRPQKGNRSDLSGINVVGVGLFYVDVIGFKEHQIRLSPLPTWGQKSPKLYLWEGKMYQTQT